MGKRTSNGQYVNRVHRFWTRQVGSKGKGIYSVGYRGSIILFKTFVKN